MFSLDKVTRDFVVEHWAALEMFWSLRTPILMMEAVYFLEEGYVVLL